jgi:hypothetical protein
VGNAVLNCIIFFLNRFSINFGCDCENETCAFHFNPRPNEEVVVRNANLGGWGDEERDYEADFPLLMNDM